MSRLSHTEVHLVQRIGWLRAAVLGANDGIVSTASLIVGVAAANSSIKAVLVAGTAGLVAGAMSMAAGEYVSVSSQADTEAADLAREQSELLNDPQSERNELIAIYRERGLDETLAVQVTDQLMAKDALAVHAREELGISHVTRARPIQAALTSALTFSLGAALPLIIILLTTPKLLIASVSLVSLVCLIALGALAAKIGGANIPKAIARVAFWGALAFAFTALIGRIFGVDTA